MKDLLEKFTDNQILHRLYDLYPDQKKNGGGYEKALLEMRCLRPKKRSMSIVVKNASDDDGEKWIDVSGHDPSDPECSYALDLTSWNEILGMSIHPDTYADFTEIDIIAHCLWEMTWHGYSNKQVRGRFRSIANTAKRAIQENSL
jgi:hypothetical protein